MAKEIYIGSDGKSKEIKNAYIGINNLARKIKKAYIGVNGVAKQFYSSGFVWKKYNVRYTPVYKYFYEYVSLETPINRSFSYNQTLYLFSPIGLGNESEAKYESEISFIQTTSLNATNYSGYIFVESRTLPNQAYAIESYSLNNNTQTVNLSSYGYRQKRQVLGHNETSIGAYISDVKSDDPNAYPENGIKDGYWYVKQS